MSKEKTEVIEIVEDNEPVYYAPKQASLVSNVANVLSWIVLVGFIAVVIIQGMSLKAQLASQGLAFSSLLKEISFLAYLAEKLLTPLLIGLGLFAVLQAASAGMNILLEMDYNSHEAKDKAIG
ncbi:MAG: hypothetical protein ABIF04_03735 [Chloroflexota bacterium]